MLFGLIRLSAAAVFKLTCLLSLSYLLVACSQDLTPTTVPTVGPPPTPDDPLRQGLIAYYPFHGNSSDESGHGNHGLLKGPTLTTDRHNSSDSAYQFDGQDDYIEIPSSASLAPVRALTISLWVYYEPQATSDYYSLVEKGDPERDGHSRWGLWLHDDIAEFCIEPNSANPIQRCLDSTTSLNVDEWNHVVGRYDGRSLHLSLNSQPAGYLEQTFAPIAHSNFNLFLGADLYQTNPVYFQGSLDEVRIYNRMLTDNEIARLGE